MDVAVYIVDGVGDLGLAAVLETFHTANRLVGEPGLAAEPWRVRTVSAGSCVRTGYGHLVPTIPLAQAPAAPDLMFVPAVLATDIDTVANVVTAPANTALLEYICAAHAAGTRMGAACTGTFFFAEAGILNGRRATTSWWLGPAFRRRYPEVDLDEGRTLCRAGNVSTAGAVLAHVDLALSFIAEHSRAQAERTARILHFGCVGSQREQIVPQQVAGGDRLVAQFESWVRDHIADQFQITDAARALGVTVRSLQRATGAEIGMSPRDFITDIRLDRATSLLRTTTLTVDAVAARVGYLNASTLRVLFRRRRGRALAEVRAVSPSWADGQLLTT